MRGGSKWRTASRFGILGHGGPRAVVCGAFRILVEGQILFDYRRTRAAIRPVECVRTSAALSDTYSKTEEEPSALELATTGLMMSSHTVYGCSILYLGTVASQIPRAEP